MREIKFRAWDIENKKMIDIGEMNVGLSVSAWIKVIGANGTTFNKMIVNGETADFMQFTGLKDAKGKEIYEGDIITSPWGNAEIFYSNGGFRMKTASHRFLFGQHRNWEIIGNIYSDSHLLKN